MQRGVLNNDAPVLRPSFGIATVLSRRQFPRPAVA